MRQGTRMARAAARETEMAAYIENAQMALDARKAKRIAEAGGEGYTRAWGSVKASQPMATGSGSYRLGRAMRRGYRSVSKYEKKHHTLGRAALGAAKRFAGVGMYTGSGAYNTVRNSLVNNPGLEGVPSFSSSGDETGAISITHREYVTEIFGPTNSFTNQAFHLNPGIEKTFPWLSQLAANYEEYEFRQLLFTYRSTTSDNGNSSSGQVGTVILATQYNPSKADWDSKQIMMGYDAAQSGKTTSDNINGVECDNAKLSGTDEKYVRSGPVVDDLKNYDHGKFQVAISNSPAT